MPNNTYNPINDALNIRQRPENHVAHTMFDRTYDFIGTGKMGQIIPFFVDETMPGDYWRCSGEYLFRFAPMYLPILSQVKVYIDYYYIPLNLLYGLPKKDAIGDLEEYAGWETFISSFNDNLQMPTVDIPLSAYTPANTTEEILSYFEIPTNPFTVVSPGVLQVQPFLFLAYLQVYDQYYRNDQVQDPRGFIWLDPLGYDWTTITDHYFQYGQQNWPINDGIIKLLRRNWDNDYYTVGTPTPQLGANVLVPMINDLSDFWSSEITSPSGTVSYPSAWKKLTDGTNAPTDAPLEIFLSDDSTVRLTSDGTDWLGLDIQSTAAAIRQLRYNLQLTEILERGLRTGDKYDDFIFKFFDEDINPLDLNIPQWFGGHVGRVVVSDVFATANTSGETPLTARTVGSYSGNAVAVDKIRQHEIKCRQHGYVMGLLSVVPESSYQNGLRTHFTRKYWYDYPFEQFALIGDREMPRSEMQLILSSSVLPTYINEYPENTETIMYVPMYHEMRYRNNVIAGQMRTLWDSYHLGRIFGQDEGDGIDLGDELLICLPRTTDVFQIANSENEIHILVHNKISVDRRLPKYAVPQTGI